MNRYPRRRFLRQSLAASASLGLLPWLARSASAPNNSNAPSALRPLGSNNDVRVAIVGLNGRGRDHIAGFKNLKGVRLTALCDVDQVVLDREVKKLKDEGIRVAGFTNYRKLLDEAEIDVVSLATPNHWHALGALWAIQAGRDVYVEKPVSHNVWEGRQIVNAARLHNRIVQTGTQCRSSVGLREAITWLQNGGLGRIKLARGLCYKRRASIGETAGAQPIPASVDYDLWCGPAPKAALRRQRLHYDWHWVWDTGNGDLGNQGIHQMDLARWVLGVNELSPRILAVGGRLGYLDDGETPNTMIVLHDYAAAPLIFEVRGLPEKSGAERMDLYRGAGVGVVVDCEHGTLVIPSYSRAIALDAAGNELRTFDEGGDHYENFITAVRSRRVSDLHADVLEGHLSSALCHTGNISYRLGKPQSPDVIRDALRNEPALAESLGRMEPHLAANGVDLRTSPAVLGVPLRMDAKAECFVAAPKADAFLTREYRVPYVVTAVT